MANRIKKECNASFERSGFQKLPKKLVTLTPSNESEFFAVLSTSALNSISSALPAKFREDFAKGKFGYEYDLAQMSYRASIYVLDRLTGTTHTIDMIVKEDAIRNRSWRREARAYGEKLVAPLVVDLKRTYADRLKDDGEFEYEAPHAEEMRQYAKPSVLLGVVTKTRKRDVPKPKICAACGPTDPKYPKWDGECGHTKEERKE